MATCGAVQSSDCDDCVQVVRDTKTVQVPCTRNTYQKYTVNVPRQVTEQVPRTVTYTDYESRPKQVPYTVNRSEKRIRMQTETYQVPVTKYYKKVVMETRERQVPVPYFVNVPETKYRTVTEQIPVQKSKVEMDQRVRTVYDTQTRTRCVPETKIVTKQIPVYNVVPKPAPPCPPGTDCGAAMSGEADYKMSENVRDFAAVDTNKDGVISYNEFTAARAAGNPVPVVGNSDVRDFAAVDTNKDGVISFNEFAAARSAGNPVVGNPAPTYVE